MGRELGGDVKVIDVHICRILTGFEQRAWLETGK